MSASRGKTCRMRYNVAAVATTEPRGLRNSSTYQCDSTHIEKSTYSNQPNRRNWCTSSTRKHWYKAITWGLGCNSRAISNDTQDVILEKQTRPADAAKAKSARFWSSYETKIRISTRKLCGSAVAALRQRCSEITKTPWRKSETLDPVFSSPNACLAKLHFEMTS